MSFEVSVHIYTGAGGTAWKGPKFFSLTVRTPYFYSMLPHTHTGVHRQTHTQAHAQTGKHTRTSYKTQALLPTAMARAMSVTT